MTYLRMSDYDPPVPQLRTSDQFGSLEEENAYLRRVAEYLREHIETLNDPDESQSRARDRFKYESIQVMNPR